MTNAARLNAPAARVQLRLKTVFRNRTISPVDSVPTPFMTLCTKSYRDWRSDALQNGFFGRETKKCLPFATMGPLVVSRSFQREGQ
jgi:hypothetical protein